MKLPPAFLDELRTRTSLSQLVGRKVAWDVKRSNPGKGDMWACCPFHQEKTASFHVAEREGFYYCFGCHAKGDAITFAMAIDNTPFLEAVESLARSAGLEMPARDPEAKKQADRLNELFDVMETACRFFRANLLVNKALPARTYLDRRGLGSDALTRFEIGAATDGWHGLFDHLRSEGVSEALIMDAGLAKRPTAGQRPHDVFRNRIMFPIRDGRGRCIAFGGRAISADEKVKYLNSAETGLFTKGRTLYNLGPAREATGRGQPLIVAEGYMDVIALVMAGFEGVVAPLGTAVTKEQLRTMWSLADEPIFALDGDTAGDRAAQRTIELALPLLAPGKSLRFATLPQGQDPDDLIRSQGPSAMHDALDGAVPVFDLIWRRETEAVFDTPERRAALDDVLRRKIDLVRNPAVRSHYAHMIETRRRHLFGSPEKGGLPDEEARTLDWSGAVVDTPSTHSTETLLTILDQKRHGQEAIVLAVLITTPSLLPEFVGSLEVLRCSDPDHREIRTILQTLPAGADPMQTIGDRIDDVALKALLKNLPMPRICASLENARAKLTDAMAKLSALRALMKEIVAIRDEVRP